MVPCSIETEAGGARMGSRGAAECAPLQPGDETVQPVWPRELRGDDDAMDDESPLQPGNDETAWPRGDTHFDGMGKVFVGGLSRATNPGSLRAYFERFGEVSDPVVMKDRSSGVPRGFGFVTFASEAVALYVTAIRHVVDGKDVEAKLAVPRVAAGGIAPEGRVYAPHAPPPCHVRQPAVQGAAQDGGGEGASKKIFVGGLSHDTAEADFVGYFGTFGQPVDYVLMCDPHTRKPRGFGFITYESAEAVDRVCAVQYHRVMGKRVEVKRAVPQQQAAAGPYRHGAPPHGDFAPGGWPHAAGYGAPHGASPPGASAHRDAHAAQLYAAYAVLVPGGGRPGSLLAVPVGVPVPPGTVPCMGAPPNPSRRPREGPKGAGPYDAGAFAAAFSSNPGSAAFANPGGGFSTATASLSAGLRTTSGGTWDGGGEAGAQQSAALADGRQLGAPMQHELLQQLQACTLQQQQLVLPQGGLAPHAPLATAGLPGFDS